MSLFDSIADAIAKGPDAKFDGLGKWADMVAKVGIFVGLAIWVIEIPDRSQQRIDAAWAMVNDAAGKPGNAGRQNALEYLNRKHISLRSTDLSNADIRGIKLPNADLSNVVFDGADVSLAEFGCLWGNLFTSVCKHGIEDAKFKDACFDSTSFVGIEVQDTVFEDSGKSAASKCANEDHFKVNFSRTFLYKVTFRNLALTAPAFRYAIFRDVTFDNVKFSDFYMQGEDPMFFRATLINVDFSKTNITMQQLSTATLCSVLMPDGKRWHRGKCN